MVEDVVSLSQTTSLPTLQLPPAEEEAITIDDDDVQAPKIVVYNESAPDDEPLSKVIDNMEKLLLDLKIHLPK